LSALGRAAAKEVTNPSPRRPARETVCVLRSFADASVQASARRRGGSIGDQHDPSFSGLPSSPRSVMLPVQPSGGTASATPDFNREGDGPTGAIGSRRPSRPPHPGHRDLHERTRRKALAHLTRLLTNFPATCRVLSASRSAAAPASARPAASCSDIAPRTSVHRSRNPRASGRPR